jgi:hypothetical protein
VFKLLAAQTTLLADERRSGNWLRFQLREQCVNGCPGRFDRCLPQPSCNELLQDGSLCGGDMVRHNGAPSAAGEGYVHMIATGARRVCTVA